MPVGPLWGILEAAWSTSSIRNIFNWSQILGETASGAFRTLAMGTGNFESCFSMQVLSSLFALLVAVVVWTGCSKKSDINSGISQLKEAFPAASTAAPSTNQNPAQNPSNQGHVNVYVEQAVALLEKRDTVGAVTLLTT